MSVIGLLFLFCGLSFFYWSFERGLLFGLLGDGVLVHVFFWCWEGIIIGEEWWQRGENGFLEVSMGRIEKR